jgi:uncharacterized lipoprotein YajG
MRAATLTALALVCLAGCGGTTRTVNVTTPATILDTERVERAIEASILQQRHVSATVTCPSGVVQRQGVTFVCIATTQKGTTPFDVTQTDSAGHVSYRAR